MILDQLKNWRRCTALAELKPAFQLGERHAREGRGHDRTEIED
jgi:hypothetical protein